MKRLFIIIIPLMLTCIIACDTKKECGCYGDEVCVTLINTTERRIENVRLQAQGINQVPSTPVEIDGKACLSFNSPGENSFIITATLPGGETISSTEMYSEGGYKFIGTITKDKIEIEESNTY